MDINRASACNSEERDTIADMFEYHEWDVQQAMKGKQIRELLQNAVEAIVELVPPCPDRTVAIRKLREARMDCNSAITHKGKY